MTKGNFTSGIYFFRWDATNRNGLKVANGIYLYRLEAKNFNKIILDNSTKINKTGDF